MNNLCLHHALHNVIVTVVVVCFPLETAVNRVFLGYTAYTTMNELVQAVRPKLSPPRITAACDIYSNIAHLVSYWPPLILKTVTSPVFFRGGSTLVQALAAEFHPGQPQPFKIKSRYSQSTIVRRYTFFQFFCLEQKYLIKQLFPYLS